MVDLLLGVSGASVVVVSSGAVDNGSQVVSPENVAFSAVFG